MSLVNEFGVTLKDFLPVRPDGMIVEDGRGTTAIVSNRLYAKLTDYAAANGVPCSRVFEQLRQEIHQIHQEPSAYALTCRNCGANGQARRANGFTIAATGFTRVRVFRNGTVSAKCQQCGCNQAVEAVSLSDPDGAGQTDAVGGDGGISRMRCEDVQ